LMYMCARLWRERFAIVAESGSAMREADSMKPPSHQCFRPQGSTHSQSKSKLTATRSKRVQPRFRISTPAAEPKIFVGGHHEMRANRTVAAAKAVADLGVVAILRRG